MTKDRAPLFLGRPVDSGDASRALDASKSKASCFSMAFGASSARCVRLYR